MESKSITLESSINFETTEKYIEYICTNIDYVTEKVKDARPEYNERENARALIEELRGQQERPVLEVTFATYFGTSRPFSADARGRDILCGSKDDRPKAKTHPVVRDEQTPKLRFLHVSAGQQRGVKTNKGKIRFKKR